MSVSFKERLLDPAGRRVAMASAPLPPVEAPTLYGRRKPR